jgi:hypothetical protein
MSGCLKAPLIRYATRSRETSKRLWRRSGCVCGVGAAEMEPLFVNRNTILLRAMHGGTQIDLHVCVLTRTKPST